jgi:glycosyltransferase involved in cell wall biosynthesis
MQRGRQIIASRVGGLPEVLGDCAHFFTPGNSEELAQKIKSVISGAVHIPSEAIYQRSNAFDFEKMLARFEDIFK